MNLLPRSLFARLFLLMVIVLSLAQVAALAIHLEDRRQLMQEVLGQHSAQRIADLVQLLEQQEPALRHQVLRRYRTPGLRVHLLQATGEPRPPSDAAAPARRLAEHLGEALGADRPLRVRLLAPEEAAPMRHRMPRMGHPGHGWMSPMAGIAALRVEVRLADGGWVAFDRRVPAGLYDWPMRMLASLGLVLVVTLVAVYYAARRLTRPLRQLAGAADVLGRDLHAEPLAETGPTEIRSAARAFNRMQQRLRAHVEERTRMLAAISHDLKTPLTRLRLRLELLEDEARTAPLVRDLDEMEAMLKASLAFARGVRSEPSTRIDLSALLRQLAADYLGAGQAVSLARELPPTWLSARPQALRRCCANLVDNALRYAGAAELDLQTQGDSVAILCRDRGPGIPDELLGEVFEPFKRVEASRNRATGGTGLGLAIALDIARAHGGGLSLRNRDGGGLEARIELPLQG